MKKIIYTILLSAITFSPVILPSATFAQTQTAVAPGSSEFGPAATPPNYTLLAPLPCVGTSNGTTCTNVNGSSQVTSISLQNYLIYLFKLLIAVAVFLAVIMIIFGGFKYMTTEAFSGKSDARATIEHAVEGLLLALASYLILYTINPNFVNISNVAIPKLNVSATSTAPSQVVTVDGSGNCHAAGQIPTRANIVPCPPGQGTQPTTSAPASAGNGGTTNNYNSRTGKSTTVNNSPAYNTNPNGTVVLPAPGTNICTTHGYNSRTHSVTTTTYPCDSNGNAL